MKKVSSKQAGVRFAFCPDPVTIDKSASWGEGNFQDFPNGVFLKFKDDGTISHGVQPNEKGDAPVGWQPTDNPELFDKLSIWVGEKVPAGEKRTISTLDGVMDYNFKEDSYLCYNGDEEANLEDCWVIKESDIVENYNM